MLLPIFPTNDFDNIKGKLHVIELPPGEYEIANWGVTSGFANLNQTRPFSVKFKIQPGKATYIGSFIFTVTDSMGLTVTGVRVDYEDRFDEDLLVLREKYPYLIDSDIFMGLEQGLVKKDIGGSSSVVLDTPPILIPIEG